MQVCGKNCKLPIGLVDAVTPASIRIYVSRNGGYIKSKLGIIIPL